MDYRLIVLNSTGDPASAEEWACASDVQAIERAARHGSSFGCELWEGDRRVSTFAGAIVPHPERPSASLGA